MSEFLLGIHYVLRGFKLITQKGMKRLLLIPMLINLSLFIAMYFGLAHFISDGNIWLIHHLPHWLAWLQYIIWLLSFLLFGIVFVYTFVLVGNILAAPFNSLIAEKLIMRYAPNQVIAKTNWQVIKGAPAIIFRQLTVLRYYFFSIIPLLLLFVIPGLQFFAPIAWGLFAAWFMALTYLDYPADNLSVQWSYVYAFAKENKWLALGFGCGNFFLASLPFINLLAIPVGVAGATALWLERVSLLKAKLELNRI